MQLHDGTIGPPLELDRPMVSLHLLDPSRVPLLTLEHGNAAGTGASIGPVARITRIVQVYFYRSFDFLLLFHRVLLSYHCSRRILASYFAFIAN